MTIDSSIWDGHFDYISSAESVNIVDSRGTYMDACRATSERGVSDLVINDLNGSLDPTGAASSGALVHDNDHVKKIFGTSGCESIGNCLAYCPGVCLRAFSLRVEQFGTENWKLLVSDTLHHQIVATRFSSNSPLISSTAHQLCAQITNTETLDSMEVPGTIYSKNEAHFSDYLTTRRFSASLPEGSFIAKFIDENGNHVWPQFVEEHWQQPPDCSGYLLKEQLTIEEPAIQESDCLELIRNGGLDPSTLTTAEPWLHTFGSNSGRVSVACEYLLFVALLLTLIICPCTTSIQDLDIGAGLGEVGDAICTAGRSDKYSGPGQNLDSRCVELMEGQFYEFSALMKVTAKNNPSVIYEAIDPNSDS